jgi:hypothetical protein
LRWIVGECFDGLSPLSEGLFNLSGRPIAQSDPNYSDVLTQYKAKSEEIGILADDRQAFGEREFHYHWIGRGLHADVPNMKGVGKCVSKTLDKLVAEILIEQQSHA